MLLFQLSMLMKDNARTVVSDRSIKLLIDIQIIKKSS